MNTDVIEIAPPDRSAGQQAAPAPEDLTAEGLAVEDLTAEDLIEEVSIDGMCGVY